MYSSIVSRLVARRTEIASSIALFLLVMSHMYLVKAVEYEPLDPAVFRIHAAHDFWYIRLEKIHNLLEVRVAAAEICLADFIFSLSPRSSVHLAQQRRSDKVSAYPCVVKNDPSSWSASVSDTRPYPATYRLIPAASPHVATQTLIVPASYALATRSLSSDVKPACIHQRYATHTSNSTDVYKISRTRFSIVRNSR